MLGVVSNMRKTIVTCDICGVERNGGFNKISLSLYDEIQCEAIYVPSKKYQDLCFNCFRGLRKAIELEIEKLSDGRITYP